MGNKIFILVPGFIFLISNLAYIIRGIGMSPPDVNPRARGLRLSVSTSTTVTHRDSNGFWIGLWVLLGKLEKLDVLPL